MATHAVPSAGQAPVPHAYLGRLWRLVVVCLLTSLALVVLRQLEQSMLFPRIYEEQAEVAGSRQAVVDGIWLVACGALIAAVLVRRWLSGAGGDTRLRLLPLVGVFAVAIVLGSLGGPLGSSIGVGLLPLLVIAYLLPRLPHAHPRRPHVGLSLLVAAVLVGTPLINTALSSLEGAAVGCGSPCQIGAAGTTPDFVLAVRNRSRLPIVITDVTLAGLPAGSREVELRYAESWSISGPLSLPLRLEPEEQTWIEDVVRVPPAACGREPFTTGAKVRYRVLGLTRTAQIEPVGHWRQGLRCRVKR